MRQNKCIGLDLKRLSFEKMDLDADGILIPLRDAPYYVMCDSNCRGRAWLVVEGYGEWSSLKLGLDTIDKICEEIAKNAGDLEDYIEWL